MKAEIENGKIIINIPDLFDQMGEEQFLSLMEDAQWHIPAYIELVNTLRTQYASENWSQTLYDLRKAFFVLDKDKYENQWDSDEIQRTMRDTVREIIKENARLKVEMYNLQVAVGNVYEWLKQNIGVDRAYELWKKYIDDKHTDALVPHEQANELVKSIPYSEMVDKWTDSMLKRFNQPSQSDVSVT